MFEYFKDVEAFFKSRQKYGIKPGLERVHALLEAVQYPEKNLKAIHVTGTNGKGSTIAYLNDSLIAQGYHVGVFSSPSLTGICGHIKINDKQILKDEIITLLTELMPHIASLDKENNHPSEFEIITVIAFLYFKDKVDFALIETGMGARLDTTNCIIPILSIITTISVDHTQFLGESIEQITEEKVGIIKPNIPVIIGHVSPESKSIIINEAKKVNAPLFFLHETFTYELISINKFIYINEKERQMVSLSMFGNHQIENATLALKALTLLANDHYLINWELVIDSMKQTQIPGRFEIISTSPLIILDGAHNESGMKSLIKTLQTTFVQKEYHVIFAAFQDKQLKTLAELIKANFHAITLTSFDHERAITTAELSNFFNMQNVCLNNHWQDVLQRLFQQDDQNVYIITGSLHFVFLVRHYIECILKNKNRQKYSNDKSNID